MAAIERNDNPGFGPVFFILRSNSLPIMSRYRAYLCESHGQRVASSDTTGTGQSGILRAVRAASDGQMRRAAARLARAACRPLPSRAPETAATRSTAEIQDFPSAHSPNPLDPSNDQSPRRRAWRCLRRGGRYAVRGRGARAPGRIRARHRSWRTGRWITEWNRRTGVINACSAREPILDA
jgi:hypothetical protein